MATDAYIADGFGNEWDAHCPQCKEKAMQVVRPGKAQCANCDGRGITPQSGLADQLLERRLSRHLIRLLQLLANGYNLKEAATELGIKHGSARNYSKFIKDALGADTLPQAVILGIRKGLIQ